MSEAVRMTVENPMAEKDAPSDEDGASDGAGGSPSKAAARPPPLSIPGEEDGEPRAEDGQFSSKDVFTVLDKAAEDFLIPMPFGGKWAVRFQLALLWAVDPTVRWRQRWDIVVLLFVIYSSLHVPYKVAFAPNPMTFDEETGLWDEQSTPTDRVVNWVFYLDIVLNFFTGYDKGYIIIMEKRDIVSHYLRTWFLVDFIATGIPTNVVVAFVLDFDGDTRPPMWISTIGLIKILRLLRASRLIDNLTKHLTIRSGYIKASKFFLYVIIVAHLLACCFFIWPAMTSYTPDAIWRLSDCKEDEALTAAASACIDDPDCDATLAEGWFYAGQCMQGSWRQALGLERICLPGRCGAALALDREATPVDFMRTCDEAPGCDALGTCDMVGDVQPLPLNSTEEAAMLRRCFDSARLGLQPSVAHNQQGVDQGYEYCPKCKRPASLYVDALYWSLTTMTTIGYGDFGPKTEGEIFYVCVAEVFGLMFFALLLTQINMVNELMGMDTAEAKKQKDQVLQFLRSRNVDQELIEETVRFCAFRKTSFTGNSYTEGDPRFKCLSEAMRDRIRSAVYLPVLQKIGFFGWDESDDQEEKSIKKFFDAIDTSGNGSLDQDELKELFNKLELDLTGEQFDKCYEELDRDGEGSVTFDEFSWWWFKTKYGVPRISSGTRCPSDFLMHIATHLTPKAFAKGERLCKRGDYGSNFVIVLGGRLRILRPGTRIGSPRSDPDNPERSTANDLFVRPTDREPMFGFSACLTKAQFSHVRSRTDFWAVDAEEYSDTLWITRDEFYKTFSDHWPTGRPDMVELAYYHYQVGLILNGKTEMDGDHDGVVTVDDFLAASARLPHGFANHYLNDPLSMGSGRHIDVSEIEALTTAAEDIKETEDEMQGVEILMGRRVERLEGRVDALRDDVGAVKESLRLIMKHHGIE